MKSQRLESVVRAAVLGLLAAATACGGSEQTTPAATGESTSGLQGAASSPSAARAGSAGSTAADSTAADSSAADSTAASSGGAGATATGSVEGVISTRTVADLSLAQFTEMCDEEEGVVETHASCAGAASGPGFSYDVDTDAFTEHTCRGFNTCRGFSCVVDA